MKKFLSIVLLFLFLITNSGMAISVHWCCGELSSICLISDAGDSCWCGDMPMESDCCKDKKVTLDASAKSELAKAAGYELKTIITDLIITPINHIEVLYLATVQYTDSDLYHPPPLNHSVPIYLLDRVFRI
ncbi:MAG: hypothetical protein HYZ42_17075 [Bacteroidetes bacterium]|nr:hypothetical protein [Bacteroidota bacterium]